MSRPLVRNGLRAVLRQPALAAAEIAWRWSFGAAAGALAVLSLHRILIGVDVSDAEMALGRGSPVFSAADTLARILYDVLPRLIQVSAVLVPALALLWIVAASLGRWATLQALPSVRGPGEEAGDAGKGSFASLLYLNSLRAAVTLAAGAGLVGAAIISGSLLNPRGDNPVAAALLWVVIATLVFFFWAVVNWFLALAPIFIVRDRRRSFAAISDSLALLRRYPRDYIATAVGFGLLRSGALLAALLLSLAPLAVTNSVPVALVLTTPVALLYFAAVDFLSIARLAAFVALADEPSLAPAVPLEPQALPVVPTISDDLAATPPDAPLPSTE